MRRHSRAAAPEHDKAHRSSSGAARTPGSFAADVSGAAQGRSGCGDRAGHRRWIADNRCAPLHHHRPGGIVHGDEGIDSTDYRRDERHWPGGRPETSPAGHPCPRRRPPCGARRADGGGHPCRRRRSGFSGSVAKFDFWAKSKNLVSGIQWLTDSQTLEKATLRQNPAGSFSMVRMMRLTRSRSASLKSLAWTRSSNASPVCRFR